MKPVGDDVWVILSCNGHNLYENNNYNKSSFVNLKPGQVRILISGKTETKINVKNAIRHIFAQDAGK